MKANKDNLFGYNKRLQPFANKLRKEMTKAEACLWKYGVPKEIERVIHGIEPPPAPASGGQ
jgi:very-short-patch-repair endonuclease